MRKVILFFSVIISYCAMAQTGELSGIVLDGAIENEPLPFVSVYLKGTTQGADTDFDGKYVISDIATGSYTVVMSFIGYKTKEIPNVIIKANEVTTLNETLELSANTLKETVITVGPKVKESEEALITEQKEAVVITQTIGIEEAAKKGASTVESAVTKIAGVTKSQGSKSVFVRGLGDRYNSTSLNGLPLPSDDPESKNISLSYFGSNAISNIGVNKTFGSSIYGDVAGANIDIKSKVISKNSLSISSSTGFNTRTIGKDFLRINGANNLGTGINESSPITDRTLGTYNFENSLQPETTLFPINSSVSLAAGGKINLPGSYKLTAFVVGSHKNSFKYKEGTSGSITADGRLSRSQDFQKYDFNTSQLLMGGVNFDYGKGNSVGLTHLFIHNNTQSVGEYRGLDTGVKDDGNEVFTRRQQLNDNDLYVNQLTGEHTFVDRLKVDYGGSFSFIAANEPDRKTNTFFIDDNGITVPAQGSAGFNHRFFSELQEDDYAGRLQLTYDLNSEDDLDDFVREVKGGINARYTKRNFIFRQFNANIINQNEVDVNNVDALFNQETLDNGDFQLVTDRGRQRDGRGRTVSPLFPFFYIGDREVWSGYAEGVYQVNESLTLNAGIRYDKIGQRVDYDTALVSSVNGARPDDSARLNKEYILPSFNAKYAFDENTILRLAGSFSYTLPQLREVAPFVYEGINFTTIGNPDIDASESYNLDAKFEYYFGEDESNLVTVTGFYKYIDSPINRVGSNSAANQITYVNVPEAQVLGFEVETKFGFDLTDETKLSFGFNGSYLYSRQIQEDLPTDDITIRFTNRTDQLQGASPWLLNGDVSYSLKNDKIDFTTSLVANYFSERIFAVGVGTNENIVESDVFGLDFINKLKINDKIGISFSVKNLDFFNNGKIITDQKIELTQEAQGQDIVLNSFRRGIDISAGFSYKF